MATWAIGDIQGCYDEFRELLGHIAFREGRDTLWIAGDMINRGPNNLDVVKFLMGTEGVVAVLGNHDLHFLAVARGFADPRSKDTVDDLLTSPDVDDVCQWLRNLPLVHTDPESRRVLVHAGLPPQWDADTCATRAREVENVLRGDAMDGFLAEMYGNEPASWSASLTGNDRLRIITNTFTRLRFCKADGTLELLSKETETPEGYSPWFAFPRPDDYTIYFGHWAAIGGETTASFAVALDTGCVWGRELTALRLEDGKRCSVPSRQPLLK